MSGSTVKDINRAEGMIKQIHGPTTKIVDKYKRTIYKNSNGKAVALKDPDDDGEQTWHIHKEAQMNETEMNLFQKAKILIEESGVKYDSGVGHTARVFSKNGVHTVKLFGANGKHNKDTDYSTRDEEDAHDFAREEMAIKKAAAKKKVNEAVDPKDHIEQTLADMDINSKVDGKNVSVHKSNKAKAARVVKKMGYDHEVSSGLNEEFYDAIDESYGGTSPTKRDFTVHYQTKDGKKKKETVSRYSPRGIVQNWPEREKELGHKLVDITHNGKSTINERINSPQGYKETADPISDESSKHGHVKKMMGNLGPLEVIAKIISKKVKPE